MAARKRKTQHHEQQQHSQPSQQRVSLSKPQPSAQPEYRQYTVFQSILLLQALLTLGPGAAMMMSPSTMLAQSMVPDLAAVSHSEIYGFASDTMRINGMLLCVIGLWALHTRWRLRRLLASVTISAATAAGHIVHDYCVVHTAYALMGMCVYGYFVTHTFIASTTHEYMRTDVSVGGMATSFVFLVLWISCMLDVFDCRSGNSGIGGGGDADAGAAGAAVIDGDSDHDVTTAASVTTTRRRRGKGQQQRQVGPPEVIEAA